MENIQAIILCRSYCVTSCCRGRGECFFIRRAGPTVCLREKQKTGFTCTDGREERRCGAVWWCCVVVSLHDKHIWPFLAVWRPPELSQLSDNWDSVRLSIHPPPPLPHSPPSLLCFKAGFLAPTHLHPLWLLIHEWDTKQSSRSSVCSWLNTHTQTHVIIINWWFSKRGPREDSRGSPTVFS